MAIEWPKKNGRKLLKKRNFCSNWPGATVNFCILFAHSVYLAKQSHERPGRSEKMRRRLIESFQVLAMGEMKNHAQNGNSIAPIEAFGNMTIFDQLEATRPLVSSSPESIPGDPLNF